jgi:hypothetical protein
VVCLLLDLSPVFGEARVVVGGASGGGSSIGAIGLGSVLGVLEVVLHLSLRLGSLVH